MRWGALAAGTLLLTSCSAIASFDGLVGSGVSGASDAGTDGSASMNVNVGTDAAINDGSTIVDDSSSGIDASPNDASTTDATPTSFCAMNPGHTFCDDFNASTIDSAWTVNHGNGTVFIDLKGKATSPPGSLNTQAPDTAGTQENSVMRVFNSGSVFSIEGNVYGEGTAKFIDFMYVQVYGTSPSFKNCYLDLDIATTTGQVEVQCVRSGVDAGAPYYDMIGTTTTRAAYHRYKLTVDLPNKLVTGTVDGTIYTRPLPEVMTPTSVQVAVGVSYLDTGNATIHVDDVLIDVTP